MPILERLFEQLKYRVFRFNGRNRIKVFGIGLPKTGTTSLTDALTALGLRSIHYPPCFELQGDRMQFSWPWWLNKFDGFSDLPVARFYREIDERHLRGRFVLTIRELDPWLDSCRRHFTPERYRADLEDPALLPAIRLNQDLFGSSVFDAGLFASAYQRHLASVQAYFRDRDDLLLLDVSAGEGWDKLCPFLGIDIPPVGFPKSNVATP